MRSTGYMTVCSCKSVSTAILWIVPDVQNLSLQLYQRMRQPTCCDPGHILQVAPHIYHSSALLYPLVLQYRMIDIFCSLGEAHSYSSPATASGLPCVCSVIFSADGTSAAGRDACVATLTVRMIDGDVAEEGG